MAAKMSRRSFVGACALGVTGAVLDISQFGDAFEEGIDESLDGLSYTRSTCSPNCTGGCGMVAATKDGKIKTIIQAADYPEEELNPRGCLRGITMPNLIYGNDRMYGPQIRIGSPGVNEFRDVSWSEALDQTASQLREIADKYGPESIGTIIQVAATGHVHKGAIVRLAGLAGWSMHGGYDMNGDLPLSAPMTFGVQSEELESYSWEDSRYTLIFGSNLMGTRIPDAHFLDSAQEKGGKIVVFDPNYSVTASKADEWFSIKPSSDAAVALGLAKCIIDNDAHDKDFIRTYTDLTFLVNVKTGKKLLAHEVKDVDVPQDIPEYRRSYVIAENGAFYPTDPTTLLHERQPSLKGTFQVPLLNGSTIEAKTAFTLLCEELEEYTPEKVEALTEIPADDLVRLANEIASVKPLHVIYGASNYQWYHGDLKGRALSLLPVVTGNIGQQGAGFSTYAGQYRLRFTPAAWWAAEGKKPNYVPFEYLVHGPTKTMTAPYPKHGIKAWIVYCCNPFDQHNLNNKLREQVENGDIEFVVNLDFQKTTSSLYSHILLPGVSWYEKTELVTTPVHQYVQLQQPAIEPFADCKPELWIIRELAKRYDPELEEYFFPEMDIQEASEQIIDLMLENGGPAVKGITLDALKKGPVKLTHTNPGRKRIPFYDQINNYMPFPPQSYPEKLETTALFVKSGRIEFYKDEDIFIAAGEALPIHKPPFVESEYALDPTIEDRYKLAFITRNAIHRVHSTHSNNFMLNELQDNKPKITLNPTQAAEKGIHDGEKVELYNDRGVLTGWATLDPGLRYECVIFEQGWWDRYTCGQSYNALIFPHIKPTHEVYFVPQMWSPNTNWNECLVDVRKVGE
jgi:anaerobic selenocysteine-containing dehydrogenase